MCTIYCTACQIFKINSSSLGNFIIQQTISVKNYNMLKRNKIQTCWHICLEMIQGLFPSLYDPWIFT